jgi:DtxR family Mn-dependent transcriptional regulator
MLKKLSDLNLIVYEPYQEVRLTDGGRGIALEVIRHHRLIELYLAEALGVPWDRVHEEAEKLEHVISEDLEERMAAALDNPRFDPHGAPIPALDGTLPRRRRKSLPLVEAEPGVSVVVTEVEDRDPELLRFLAGLGIGIETRLGVVETEPFGGSIVLRLKDRECRLGLDAARRIRVVEA